MDRQIERDIGRRQGKIKELQNEIQRLEHFLGGKKSYLASLKETLARENNEVQKQEKLRLSTDSKYVSFLCHMFYFSERCYTLYAK